MKQKSWMLCAFLPILVWLYIAINEEINSDYIPAWVNSNEFMIKYWYVIFVAFVYLMTFFFIWHVIKNNNLSEKEKYGWAISLFFFNLLLNPYYWWKYIKDSFVTDRRTK